MIHTATLYYNFTPDEMKILYYKYNDINTFLFDLDSCFHGITSHIHFKYNYALYITIDFIKLLDTSSITDEHYEISEKIINNFLINLNLSLNDMTLIRIDYRKDIKTKDLIERDMILNCLKKSLDLYWFRSKNSHFDTTIYYNNKSVQVIAYDKEQERIDKTLPITEIEQDILRFEVRLLNKHLNSQKQKHGIDKTLKNYFSIEKHNYYFRHYVLSVFLPGDFCTYDLAEEKINSSKLKESDKSLLRKFLKTVEEKGLTTCRNTLTNYKYKKILTLLKNLNINPLISTYFNPFIKEIKNPLNCYTI